MKVLHLNNFYGGSGADLTFQLTLQALTEYTNFTHKSAFIPTTIPTTTSHNPQPNLILSDWQDREYLGKLNYIYSSKNAYLLDNYLTEFQPDILHAHGFYAAISPSILSSIKKAKSKWGMKFIHTQHSHELICANANAYDYKQNRICTDCKGKALKLNILYRRCDHRGWLASWAKGIRYFLAHQILTQKSLTDLFICPSELMQSNLIEEGIPDIKLQLTRNPVALPTPSNTDLETQKPRQNEIIYFGRFSREKNLELAIHAFRSFYTENMDWRLVLIGAGDQQANLENLIRDYKLQHCISILPFMSQPALYKRLAQGKIMLMCSEVLENAPLVIPESVHCGLLPLVPNHGGMRELVALLGIGQTYKHGQTDSLTQGLTKAAAQIKNGIKFDAAQNFIQNNLSLQAYAQKMSRTYKQLTTQ